MGEPDSVWEVASGTDRDESIIVIRLVGIKQAHVRRLHRRVEDMMSEDFDE